MTICSCLLSAHRFVQALERVGFGDSTVKGCALGQASCSTMSCLNCATAPGKKLQQEMKSKPQLPHHARSDSVLLTSFAGPRPRVCLLADLQHPEVPQAQVPAA